MGSSGSNYIHSFLYSYLFVPDPDGRLIPDLATKWQYDPENLSWEIHLRENALFHNGTPVRSGDVKHSLIEGMKTYHPGLLPMIKHV